MGSSRSSRKFDFLVDILPKEDKLAHLANYSFMLILIVYIVTQKCLLPVISSLKLSEKTPANMSTGVISDLSCSIAAFFHSDSVNIV